MKFLLVTTCLFLAFSCCRAQNKIVGVAFLDSTGKYVSKRDSANTIRVVAAPDSGTTLYTISEYYKNGAKKLIGKSSTIDPPRFEGQRLTFYKSGKRKSVSSYKDGSLVGDDYNFFPNGKIYCERQFPDNGDQMNDYKGNYLIEACYDSLGTALVVDGNGYYKGFDNGFKYINEEGAVKNGRRDGEWKGKDEGLGVTFTERYKDGTLLDGVSTDKSGQTVNYTTRGTEPQYKGGLDAFYKYLGGHINYPDDARTNNIQGRVILNFIVEKDNKLSNIKVIRSVSPSIDAEAVRVLKFSSNWMAGTRFGRKVRVSYTIPINFTLTEE